MTDKIRFLHIPKTAGSTLIRILKTLYPEKRAFEFSGLAKEDAKRLGSLGAQGLEDLDLVLGHAPLFTGFPQIDALPVITVIRDPIKRVKSFCHHVYEGKSPYLLESIPPEKFDLDVFLESGNLELSNLQTKMLINTGCCDGPDPLSGLPAESAVAMAMENLLEKVRCYGIQEKFDESLVLFARRLGLGKAPYYASYNERSTKKQLEFKPRHLRRIAELNALDIELYRQADAKFSSIVDAERDFQAEVAAFKRNQQLVARFIRPWNWAKRHSRSVSRMFGSRLGKADGSPFGRLGVKYAPHIFFPPLLDALAQWAAFKSF